MVLRSFTAADVEAMGPILADPQVLALTGSVHTTEAAHAGSPVLDAATDVCVGEVVLNDWRVQDQAISFRTLIGPAGRDRGLGTQATVLVLEHAFTVSDVHRVDAVVMSVLRPQWAVRRPA